MWWDWKTYLWNKNTLVDEMPVAEVSRRMSTFRYWTHYEVWAVAIWTIVFTALFYWVMDYYMLPLGVQAVPIDMLHYLGCHSYLFHLQRDSSINISTILKRI